MLRRVSVLEHVSAGHEQFHFFLLDPLQQLIHLGDDRRLLLHQRLERCVKLIVGCHPGELDFILAHLINQLQRARVAVQPIVEVVIKRLEAFELIWKRKSRD